MGVNVLTAPKVKKSQEFTTSGTWTLPIGVSWVDIVLVGGGQTGETGGTQQYIAMSGRGGDSGEVIERTIYGISGNITVTIGAASSASSLATGNSSSLSGGVTLTALGGGATTTPASKGNSGCSVSIYAGGVSGVARVNNSIGLGGSTGYRGGVGGDGGSAGLDAANTYFGNPGTTGKPGYCLITWEE